MIDQRIRSKRVSRNSAQRSAHYRAELLLAITHSLSETESYVDGVSAIIGMSVRELDAERGSLFFNDPMTNELFFFLLDDEDQRQIRISNSSGIAGHVFTTGEPAIITDAYSDQRFNKSVDQQTGFLTRSVLCVPIKSSRGEIVGVGQLLNKKSGFFSVEDMSLFAAMVNVGVLTLKGTHFPELRSGDRAKKAHFLEPMIRCDSC